MTTPETPATRTYTEEEAVTLRTVAVREVRALQLDHAVRDAAKLGTFDGATTYRIVRYSSVRPAVIVTATWDEAPNSASVHIGHGVWPETEAYLAHHYGALVVTYRRGWWVEVIQQMAEEHRAAEAAERLAQAERARRDDASRFLPWPDQLWNSSPK